MKRLIIVGLLLLQGWTLYSQESKSDSNKMVPVVFWKLERLLDVFFYDLPSALKTIETQAIALASIRGALNDSKQVVASLSTEGEILQEQVTTLQSKAVNREAIHASEKKQVKKKAFKRGLLAGIALGLIALVI
jgi:hypothetical protein